MKRFILYGIAGDFPTVADMPGESVEVEIDRYFTLEAAQAEVQAQRGKSYDWYRVLDIAIGESGRFVESGSLHGLSK